MSFLGFDSLDALRASLTARLGAESSTGRTAEEFGPVIGRLLLDEARASEAHIAAMRLALSLAYVGLVVASASFGAFNVLSPIGFAAAIWCIASAMLYLALRRGWYRLGLRRIAPTIDGLAIVAGSALCASQLVSSIETRVAIAGNAALLCAFLVFTGALRLTKVSTYLSSTVAVLAFLSIALIVRLSPLPTIGIVAGILASSALAGRVTEAVRRVVATQVEALTMERQVERADARVAEVQAANKAREEVLRIVAHDLRNPLGTILMSADMLAEPTMSQEWREKQAGVIKRAGARMNRLIRDLLDVARLETSGMAIAPTPIAPSELAAQALETMRPLAEEKSLELIDLLESSLPDVSADPERIHQVFSNLIGNAIKFTPAPGQITLRAELAGGRVWFSVTDSGPGIPPEQLDKIFGRFWQARNTDSRGIGLGLAIAKGIVEAHGGAIGVDSEVGVGTKFWFSLHAGNVIPPATIRIGSGARQQVTSSSIS